MEREGEGLEGERRSSLYKYLFLKKSFSYLRQNSDPKMKLCLCPHPPLPSPNPRIPCKKTSLALPTTPHTHLVGSRVTAQGQRGAHRAAVSQWTDASLPGVVAGGGGGVHARRAVEAGVTLAAGGRQVGAITELSAQALLALAGVPQPRGVTEGPRRAGRPVAPGASRAVEAFRAQAVARGGVAYKHKTQ